MAAASWFPQPPLRAPPTSIEAREIDRLVTLGQTQPQSVFEIMGRKGELTPAQIELRTRFSEGLAAYRAQRWDEARRAFDAALAGRSRRRTVDDVHQAHRKAGDNSARGDWDGSWHLEHK